MIIIKRTSKIIIVSVVFSPIFFRFKFQLREKKNDSYARDHLTDVIIGNAKQLFSIIFVQTEWILNGHKVNYSTVNLITGIFFLSRYSPIEVYGHCQSTNILLAVLIPIQRQAAWSAFTSLFTQ